MSKKNRRKKKDVNPEEEVHSTRNYDVVDDRKNGGGIIKMWTKKVPVESGVYDQLKLASRMPFVSPHIAVMPDCHIGVGSTIGTVLPTKSAIIPATVGVDIGCGMCAIRTSLTASDLPESLKTLRGQIEHAVPHGRTKGGSGDKGSWASPPNLISNTWRQKLWPGFEPIIDKYKHLEKQNHHMHLGTLGGGNHFIEVCLDEEERVWVMLHSGSRGIGNAIGRLFIGLAQKDMEQWHIHLPNKDLAYLPVGTQHFDDYWEALQWAQNFARISRDIMMTRVLDVLRKSPELPGFTMDKTAVNCHHNYVAKENHFGENLFITRKGAICARKGMLGIIPGSMGAKSFIVEGLGNVDSLHSCSHGAGRKMSRSHAKAKFTLDDHIRATQGVECRKDEDVIDETPGAYKSIEDVMESQKDIVEIKHTLKQVLCVKG